MGAHRRLDGVGDDLTRLQRIAHPIRPHRNAITDADGVEAHPHQARSDHPFLDKGGQIIQMHVAGIALIPNTGDPYLSFVHIRFAHPGAIQHRLRGAL